jgi:hypothetical protein
MNRKKLETFMEWLRRDDAGKKRLKKMYEKIPLHKRLEEKQYSFED